MESTNKNYSPFFILIIIALEAILFSIGNNKSENKFIDEENKIKKIQAVFKNISVEAKAFSIYDQTLDRKIYGRNDETPMPIASLTKIMTAVVALNTKNMDEVITISFDALKQEGDFGLYVNEKFKIKDLTKITLINSANDGAYALSENVSDVLEKMNVKARKIGMENTLFFNSTGLDINNMETGLPTHAGAYASAEDVNIMTIYASRAYPEIFNMSVLSEKNIKSESGFTHNVKNTNTIIDKIPNILFSKTGYTPFSGGSLTVIYKNEDEHEIAITILGSTIEGRFSDMEKIINTLTYLFYKK